ncbi:MAG TPA: DUF1641 domain-containing protein [Thermoplasmata archaeon]|nr:DUF1641 domain-containing protein [Thermoplasmata archaeon]HTW56375.1 DUF1641 domain-containing protein [Thermoplasmata archaeon]
MAEPISEIVGSPDDEDLIREWRTLWETPGHRAAIERTVALLRALNEHGYLDAVEATVEGGPAVQAALARFLAQSQDVRLAQNLKVLFELAARVDLKTTLGAAGGPGHAPSPARRPMGLFELRRRLRDPDVSAGIETLLELFAALGRAQRTR